MIRMIDVLILTTCLLYTSFYGLAADQPLVHIRYFSDSALADECEGSSAENGWSNKFNEGDWEPGAELYSKCNATTDAGACLLYTSRLFLQF